jgi:hypothetical protein
MMGSSEYSNMHQTIHLQQCHIVSYPYIFMIAYGCLKRRVTKIITSVTITPLSKPVWGDLLLADFKPYFASCIIEFR